MTHWLLENRNLGDPSNCYSKLLELKMTETQLQNYHYPRPHPSIPGKAQLFNIETSYLKIMPGPDRRNCTRCRKQYLVGTNGLPTVQELCYYHPYRAGGGPNPTHRCCNQVKNSRPCARTTRHVNEDIDPENLDGFVTTKDSNVTLDNIVALDCEMVCTKAGLELASISVVDDALNLVYETRVLPDNPIIDYLTDYSSLTENHFRGVTTSLKDVHEKLFTLIGDRTIVVGHALSNDFLWLKLFHDNIVDTSMVYPHVRGGTFRNSLSFLKSRFIDPETEDHAHSKCRNDAESAMKLALLKCK